MFTTDEVFHQTLAVLPIILNEISMGYVYAWVAPTLRKLQSPNAEVLLDNEQCSWIGSLLELGRIIGPFLTGGFVDKIGRRNILIICTILFFIPWPFIIFTKSVAVLYAVRVIFGLAVGINDVCSSIYVGENCNPKLRAIFSSISIMFFYAGELVEFVVATCLPYNVVALVNSVMTFLALFGILVTIETPQYLIIKNNLEKAQKNFNWLRGKQEDDGEFEKLKKFVDQENAEKIVYKTLFANNIYYQPILLILILCIFMMMTGFSAVISFVSIAFTESEMLTPNEFTTLFGLCQFIAVCASPFFIDQFNRKTILVTSFATTAIIHSATAALYYATLHDFYIPQSPWLIFSSITLYAMVFSFGLHPIFYTIRGELFPQNIKAIGGTIAIIGHSIIGFISSKMFLLIAEMYGIYINFLMFAIFSAVAIIFVHFWIPETKGKTLAEIQFELRNKCKKGEN